MGIIILTAEGDNGYQIVDGQQRMISLSLLANALRLVAIEKEFSLVAKSIRDGLLFKPNYIKGTEEPRLSLHDADDAQVFDMLLNTSDPNLDPNYSANSRIYEAQIYLLEALRSDIKHAPSNRLNSWATFVTEKIFISAFINDSTVSAYKVFEVVNARGKSLTPAEMIKAYVIGSVSPQGREDAMNRWTSLETLFKDLGDEAQLTQFIRHTLAMYFGLILPRDLYKAVTEKFPKDKVVDLLDLLEKHVGTYACFLDSSIEIVDVSDSFRQSAAILAELGLTTVRPAAMALEVNGLGKQEFESLMEVIIPRSVLGSFGTGSVEGKFARFSQKVNAGASNFLDHLEQITELKPEKEMFKSAVRTRNLGKQVKSVLRHSLVFDSKLPPITGYLHLVHRSKNDIWDGFTPDQFEVLGRTIGNSVLLNVERRPRNSGDPDTISDRLGPELFNFDGYQELVTAQMLDNWTASLVEDLNEQFATALAEIWYSSSEGGF